MKRRYFIAQSVVELSDDKATNSFLAKPKRKGYIRLYELNSWTTTYFRIVQQADDRFGWIVERAKPVPSYWRKVVLPT
jgi:hypothetical protein